MFFSLQNLYIPFSSIASSCLQEAFQREITVRNSRTKEVKLKVTGDYYTEHEMEHDLGLQACFGPIRDTPCIVV